AEPADGRARRRARRRVRVRERARGDTACRPGGGHGVLRRRRELRRDPARVRVHRHARHGRRRDRLAARRRHRPLRARLHAVRLLGARDHLPLLPGAADAARGRAGARRPPARVARGGREPRRAGLALLGARRPAGARAVVPRRLPAPLRQRVLGLRDRIRARRRQRQPRSDPDRIGAERQRPLRPAPRAGARIRNGRRHGRDDAPLRTHQPPRLAVDAVRRPALFPALTLIGAAAFFLIPLGATLEFSLRTAGGHGFGAYGDLLKQHQFWSTLGLSLRLAGESIAAVLVLLVPTAYWVHLRAPRLRPLVAFLCVLPFVVPPIVLIVGLLGIFRGAPGWWLGSPQFLVPGYVVLSLPYAWFSLDAGLRSIDVRTLSEAAHSLGAGSLRTLSLVILPGLRAAVLAASLLTLAIVLGE